MDYERIIQYLLILPTAYLILLIVRAVFVVTRKQPAALAISGLGISFVIKSGCSYYNPLHPSGCDLVVTHTVTPQGEKKAEEDDI